MNVVQRHPLVVDRRGFFRSTACAGALALGLTAGSSRAQQSIARPVRVRVWAEGTAPHTVYPEDIDGALADCLARNPAFAPQRARLSDADAGLSDAALDATDVLIWWGRLHHDDVPSDRAEAVVRRVRAGALGFIALHSSCTSKPFKGLMGHQCEPGGWREDGRPEHVRVASPGHPIAQGVVNFTVPRTDMFAEPFDVPDPETVVLVSSWDQGENVRSGLTWTVGKGRVVYLRTGHDAFPVLFHPQMLLLVNNACLWAARVT